MSKIKDAGKIIADISFDRKTEKCIVKSLLWSVELYGVETWALSSGVMKRLDSFEIWR